MHVVKTETVGVCILKPGGAALCGYSDQSRHG